MQQMQLDLDDSGFSPQALAGQKWHFLHPFLRVAHESPFSLPAALLSLWRGLWLHGDQGLGGKEEASQAIMGIQWLISSVYCSENEVTSLFAWQLIDEHFLSAAEELFCFAGLHVYGLPVDANPDVLQPFPLPGC